MHSSRFHINPLPATFHSKNILFQLDNCRIEALSGGSVVGVQTTTRIGNSLCTLLLHANRRDGHAFCYSSPSSTHEKYRFAR